MKIHLIPQPYQLELLAGNTTFNGYSDIEFDSDDFVFAAQFLQHELLSNTGGNRSEQLTIRIKKEKKLAHNAYRITLNDNALILLASSSEGAWYAVQTVRQLACQAEQQDGQQQLPHLYIEDKPAFAYRGMHLDVSRHFFNVEFIKKYIDLIALHKMNYFHWHLTDDQGWRLEIKKYPLLVEIGAYRRGTVKGHTMSADSTLDEVEHGGYYTQDEVREVVKYAADRHITVVPEIDVPGHAAAMIAAYPEFGCAHETEVKTDFGIFKQVLCPLDKTFDFLSDIFMEVTELFPSPYIHIGGDEVIKDNWRNCKSCQQLMIDQGLQDLDQLQAYFVNQTEKIINKLGKQIIGWDEILAGDIHSSATIMAWQSIERGIEAAEQGHDVIMTPASAVYFDAYQSTSLDEPLAIHGLLRLRDVYLFNPVPSHLPASGREKILGAQANLWTEYIATEKAVEYMTLPRLSALAEVLWSTQSNKDYSSFLQRLDTFNLYVKKLGYEVSGSNYKPEIEVRLQSGQFLVSMDVDQGDIYYTFDGTLPDLNSSIYTENLTVKTGCTIRARSWNSKKKHWYGDSKMTVNPHKGLGSKIILTEDSKTSQLVNNSDILLSGIIASDRIFQNPEWLCFDDQKLDIKLEFANKTLISGISVGVRALQRKFHKPTKIAVYSSTDKLDWILVGYMNTEDIDRAGNRLDLNFPTIEMDLMRLVVINDRHYWSAEKEAMIRSTISIDEIIVI